MCICVTDYVVYGSSYILQKGFRAGGLGAKLSRTMLYTLRNELKTKALIGRAGRFFLGVQYSNVFSSSHVEAVCQPTDEC